MTLIDGIDFPLEFRSAVNYNSQNTKNLNFIF